MTGILISGLFPSGAPNRRKASHRRVLLGGTIADTAGLWTEDCTIRQISVFGAQVAFDAALSVPDEVFLIDAKHHMGYRAKVAWRRPGRAGLEFRQSYPVDEALPARLKFLLRALMTRKLAQVDTLKAKGNALEDALGTAGMTAETYRRWRDETGAGRDGKHPLHTRMHELEAQNAVLQQQISSLSRRVLSAREDTNGVPSSASEES